MATPDVSVHVEEVVVVTTPDNMVDGNAVEDVKTVLVATNVAQGSDGLSEESMETETVTAAAFTATSQLKEEILEVKIEEEVENIEPEIIYPITCGESKANLIWRKFVCPGINVKCVQYNELLLSPKEFVHISGKSTLKDWKRAIRMNGVMLRKIMDSGELDFYQHMKFCSNTCRSTKIDLSGTRASFSSQQSTEFIPITPASADVNGSPATITIDASEDCSDWITSIGEDTFMFWRGLKEAGLLEEVIQDFQEQMEETLRGLLEKAQQPPLHVTDAVLLNNIVQNFGMLDLVKKILASHKSQMDRSREQYARDLAALEQQCDEHRKRARELKHKSQHLNNVLMTLTPVSTPTPLKRPRLTRATSGPAAMASNVTTQSAQISLTPSGVPIAHLANLPLGKVVSAIPSASKGSSQTATIATTASPLLGGYTVLASPSSSFPGALEIHPDASNLTVLSTAAIQDGSTLVKVMSPFQLLTLPGLGTAIQNMTQVATSGNTIVALPSGTIEATGSAEEGTTIEVTTVTEEQEQK
ncbi:glucocorticoid modulatory element-binding protein 2 [Latimeria chalumnae]|uniref:glucocorticoid modulatory element-binding protein 2 n=1 Tax=Latimeria chalumnae TaxID=7897 RepID=UPI0006D9385C|nr:PREDICTED: glucocorticoid modulatory element-binding protein 2 [Latimeria chalumnae]|eukprot:XP_014351764.1 PREDICTED: glucocorticoid modulatory element-binding protein 2 [Latimeria chalumnae]